MNRSIAGTQRLASGATRSVRSRAGHRRTLCLMVFMGCLLFHPWQATSGQEAGHEEKAPGGDAARDGADAAWSRRVVLTSGDSFVGTLTGWTSDSGWTFDVADPSEPEESDEASQEPRERSVAASELVRYGAAPLPESISGVLLVDGSELAGRIVELDADTCRLVSRWFDVAIPLESIRSLLFNAPVEDHVRQQQLSVAERATGTDDVVLLVDGGRREGTLHLPKASFSPRRADAAVELRTAGEESVSIPVRRIRSIIPSPILREDLVRRFDAEKESRAGGNARPPAMRIALLDGSVLTVEQSEASGVAGASSVRLECGVELSWRRNQPTELTEIIAMLAPMPLPNNCLTAEPPLRFRHLPFFGEPQPLVRWETEQSGPPLGGFRYPTGLMMRTAARAVYATKGAERLVGAVAAIKPTWATVPDVQMRMNLGLRFGVYTSGPRGEAVQLWDSGVMRPGEAPIPFDLDVSGAALIILAADPVASGDFGDRAVWLDLIAAPAEAP